MDIVSIIFLIAGWILDIKGLVIAALSVAGVDLLLSYIALLYTEKEESAKRHKITLFIMCVTISLSIVRLCM